MSTRQTVCTHFVLGVAILLAPSLVACQEAQAAQPRLPIEAAKGDSAGTAVSPDRVGTGRTPTEPHIAISLSRAIRCSWGRSPLTELQAPQSSCRLSKWSVPPLL